MNEREKTEWIAHNELLQSAYRKWLHGNQKEKEAACSAMQRELEWPPFTDYVSSNSMANPSGISRYGLDYITEKLIGEINEIANGTKEYLP